MMGNPECRGHLQSSLNEVLGLRQLFTQRLGEKNSIEIVIICKFEKKIKIYNMSNLTKSNFRIKRSRANI